jgi:hypothetical protein
MKDIIEKNILFVEGKDECYFFNYFHKYLGLSGIQVIDCEGTGNFKTKLQLYVQSDAFKTVKTVGFIRDADSNAENAFASLRKIIKETSDIRYLPVPKKPSEIISDKGLKLGVFIMPNNSGAGMLESLCIETIKNEPVYECVDKFINCFTRLFTEEEKEKFREHKSRIQSYLATRIPIAKSIADGAQKKYWNFDHEGFSEINKFVTELFS